MKKKLIFYTGLVSACTSIPYTGNGAEVLWDTHHGLAPGFNVAERYSRLFEILLEEGITVVISDSGVLHHDLSQFDGLVISAATTFDSPYSDEEGSIIEDFANLGGGLLILGDICSRTQNINTVAERFGVTTDIANTIFPQILQPMILHPIFEGVDVIVLNCASVLTVAPPSIPAAANPIGEIGVALTEVGIGRVVITGDQSPFEQCCLLLECCGPGDNETFARNLFRWLLRACEPLEPPQVRSQGYWRRQCNDADTPEDICSLVERIHDVSDHFDDYDCEAVCDLMQVDPPENDMCRKAERQFMALLLNLASGKTTSCNCLLDGRTVEDVISEIDLLLSGSPDHATCVMAMGMAEEINSGESHVNCNTHAFDDLEIEEKEVLTSTPNPFMTQTLIRYKVPLTNEMFESPMTDGGSYNKKKVSLKIFDITGRLVKVLVEGEDGAGSYQVEWKGLDGRGQRVPSGIYFSRLEMGERIITQKLTILR